MAADIKYKKQDMNMKKKQNMNFKDKKKYDVKGMNVKPAMRKNQIMREEIEKLKEMKTKLPEMTAEDVKSFADLPLSSKTLLGLKRAGFTVPTKVQRQTLLYSLGGCDVVGAAKTGSGKTLAFIIPILEKLYATTWTHLDGLGALVITPTRELAYQIFDVLNKVGKEHDFSAGLVIGGTDLEFEAKRIGSCNIMICTPGRLLQHMTENPGFVCENIQMLILDEADMCLSMGFSDSINCILEELPTERQTLLFSATQTRDVKDLIRAGCKSPVFCSVHEHSKTSTPKSLVESYVICEAQDKFNFLWSFITYHKKQKILVFLSTCKQVKYIYSMFCKFQPGLSVLGLYGKMKQLKRMAIYDQFCRKESAVLFATDVAARGLDIPAVHWVVQADCPEDVTTYIHRAGRTARYSNNGEALLILTPSEEPSMVAQLKARNIPIEKISIDSSKQRSINVKIEMVLTKYKEIKEDAVRAFKSYIKHVAHMKDKKVFNVLSIDQDAYARSLGLIVTPRVRFLEKLLKQRFGDHGIKKINAKNQHSGDHSRTTLDFGNFESDDDDDDSFLISSKNQNVPVIEDYDPSQPKISNKQKKKRITKEDVAQKLIRKNIKVNTIKTFDDEGNEVADPNKVEIPDTTVSGDQSIHGISIEEQKIRLKEVDRVDKEVHKAKIKEKKQIQKQKEKELRRQAREERKGKKEDDEEEGEEEEESEDEYTQELIDSLPDPDKIYGKKKDDQDDSGTDEESDGSEMDDGSGSASDDDDDDDDDNDGSEASSSDEEEDAKGLVEKSSKFSGKRKARDKFREAKRAKLAQSNTLSALPVDEQEQLALFLLSGGKK